MNSETIPKDNDTSAFHMKYLPLRILAEGSYGKVLLAVRLHSISKKQFKVGEKVAIKMFIHPVWPSLPKDIDKQDPKYLELQSKQAEFQESMRHFYNEKNYLR